MIFGAILVAVVWGFTVQRVRGEAAEATASEFRKNANLALALDVDAWVGGGSGTPATALLAQQGWRAAGVGPRDRLEARWQELGTTARSAARASTRRTTEVGS